MQIFRGVGEVFDIYISQKRRGFNCSKFGFVRFKRLDEATNTINNMNGAKIRGRRIKVAFAKYGKKDLFRNGSVIVETEKAEEQVRDNEKIRTNTRDGRSFKEVVEGWTQHPKIDDRLRRYTSIMEDPSDDENSRQLEKVKLKGMVKGLIGEIFNSNNLEGIKRRVGTVLEEVNHAVEAQLHCSGKENKKLKEEGESIRRRVFLE